MKYQSSTAIGLIAALAACSTPMPEIRQIASPLQVGNLPSNERLAEGHGQMRLGNVGLALEAYRKALRSDPNNPDAHVAMANAYDQIGRTDLSGRYYEQALALAPERPDLYERLAVSLARQGKPVEAARVKAEAMARADMMHRQKVAEQQLAVVADAEEAQQPASSVTVKLAPAVPRMAEAPLPQPDPEPEPLPPLVIARLDAVEAARAPQQVDAGKFAAPAKLLPSAIDLPPLTAAPMRIQMVGISPLGPVLPGDIAVERRGADARIAATRIDLNLMEIEAPVEVKNAGAPTRIAATQPMAAPLPTRPAPKPERIEIAEVRYEGPRVERINAGEVSLITSAAPQWRSAEAAPPVKVPANVRPIQAQARPSEVQFTRNSFDVAPVLLVDASGAVGQNAQAYLVTQGYRQAELDIAPMERDRSILLYPSGKRAEAEALVKRLGIKVAFQVGPVDKMTLHLGRDAASWRSLQG